MQIRLILGDQLNASHSWFRQVDGSVLYLMAELPQELYYVRHHQQKIVAFFAAMRSFAQALRAAGHQVRYFTLRESQAFADLPALLTQLLRESGASHFAYQQPDEYRLDQQLTQFCQNLGIANTTADTEHFLTPRHSWQQLSHSRMEYFYRALRKQYRLLVDDNLQPLGGQWNFDHDNRQPWPADLTPPPPLLFANPVADITEMLTELQVPSFGEPVTDYLSWPVTRQQAKQLLQYFVSELLPNFGRYQDALTSKGWSLFHCRLSFCLNSKMLHPLQVINAAIAQYHAQPQRIGLPQVEGFVRQILGWREYVRAVYWQHMPEYRQQNFLQATRQLPAYFWTANTQMACLQHALGQSLEFSYAHHIQRLMVIGNFALLAGLAPEQVDDWYLGVYIDAIEWVELPNTRGMSQYADGGLIASKPYISSGAYIAKMGDYCKQCRYAVKQKIGPDSCPYNSLYWHFLHRHQAVLQGNPRLALPYRQWQRQTEQQREAILATAEQHLLNLNSL